MGMEYGRKEGEESEVRRKGGAENGDWMGKR
jgi:hypothetical protein